MYILLKYKTILEYYMENEIFPQKKKKHIFSVHPRHRIKEGRSTRRNKEEYRNGCKGLYSPDLMLAFWQEFIRLYTDSFNVYNVFIFVELAKQKCSTKTTQPHTHTRPCTSSVLIEFAKFSSKSERRDFYAFLCIRWRAKV